MWEPDIRSHIQIPISLKKNGWKGVCIDADLNQVALLRRERSNVEWAAISQEEGAITFFQGFLSELSTTVPQNEYKGIFKIPPRKTVQVLSCHLESILEKHHIGVIDILDIDVEGAELEVWGTFDYEKHRPQVVIIEYYTLGLGDKSQPIKAYFANLPYHLVHITCSNFVFQRMEREMVPRPLNPMRRRCF
jgi:FkbM family methyltransferase